MANDALQRYINTIPKIYRPAFNRVILALITAIAQEDDNICQQIQNAKDQLFVRTATGTNLDKISNSLGVSRPQQLGLTDAEYQELVPNLSLKPKQIKKSFYDTSDVFWGPLFSRANITTSNAATFDVSPGDLLRIRIDAGEIQEVKVLTGDVTTPGAMTADEVTNFLNNKVDGVTATQLTDALTGDVSVNLRTNTPGAVGKIEILDGSTAVSPTKLGFKVGVTTILDLDQRVSIYNINPNELLIEIPAIVPALRRTLKGSHHFHADGTLEAPANEWKGSFLFNPDGQGGTFTISSQKAAIQQEIDKGEIYPSIAVDDNSNFEEATGLLIFGFGTEREEQPVRFRGLPNSSTVLLDPSYTFKFDHPIGENINVLRSVEPYTPQRTGKDLAIYMTSPSGAREIVQTILETLKAAGIILRFVVLAPTYKYLCDNPYISDDDAPSAED